MKMLQMEGKMDIQNMTLTEYAEEHFMPTYERLLAKVCSGGIINDELSAILRDLDSLDKKAVGRYLGRKSGLPMHESDEMLKESYEAGKKYEELLQKAEEIRNNVQQQKVL